MCVLFRSIRFARCDCIEGTLWEHVITGIAGLRRAKTQQSGIYSFNLADAQRHVII